MSGVQNARLLGEAATTRPSRAAGRRHCRSNAFPTNGRDDLSMLDLPQVDRVADAQRHGPAIDTLDGDTFRSVRSPTSPAHGTPTASRVPAVPGGGDRRGKTPNGVAEYNVWVDRSRPKR